MQKYCSECGYKLEGKPKFCPECGNKLSIKKLEADADVLNLKEEESNKLLNNNIKKRNKILSVNLILAIIVVSIIILAIYVNFINFQIFEPTKESSNNKDNLFFDGSGINFESMILDVEGIEDKTSNPFYISGNECHLTIQLSSDSSFPYFWIHVHDENGDIVEEYVSDDSFVFMGKINILEGAGWYYLNIGAANLEYWHIWAYDTCELPKFSKKYHGNIDKVQITTHSIESSEVTYDSDYDVSLIETKVTGTAKNIDDELLGNVCIRCTFFDENNNFLN